MRAVSSASCALSTQTSCQPRSRTARASLCSVPKAPGSSSARLPTMAIMGMRSAGVTVSASMAYIQPTPLDPTNARAHGGSVLDDLELRVFAFRHDVFAIQLAMRHQLGNILHDGVIGADGVG